MNPVDNNFASAVVDAYLEALIAGNIDAARGYLSDDSFSYRSPIGSSDNADDFITSIWGVTGILQGVEIRRRFTDGQEVCDLLEFLVSWDTLVRFPVAHWVKVERDKILSIDAIFDAHDYKTMFFQQETSLPGD